MVEIEIKNWEKYNPRKDLKATSWFRLSNGLFEDSVFFALSTEAKLVWLYCLCQASKTQSGTIKINISLASALTQLAPSHITDSIVNLNRLGMLEARHAHVTSTSRPRTTTNEQHATNGTNETNVSTTSRKRNVDGTDKITRVSKSGLTWDAYRDAYRSRHGAEPVRNAKVNAHLSQLVDQVGSEDAPEIARYFVGHNDRFYLQRHHDTGLLVRDAQALRTQWLTGRKVTGLDAADLERRQANADVFQTLLAKEQQK